MPKVVMIGPGYGVEINNGQVLTALHVALKMDYPFIYTDEDKDIAIVETGHKNKYNLSFICSDSCFLFFEEVPQSGESGKPLVIDGKVHGVIIGESDGHGVVAAFDDSIIRLLNRK